MSNVDINVDRRTDGLTDGRTDRRKIGRLYRTLLQAGAIKSSLHSIIITLFRKKTERTLLKFLSHLCTKIRKQAPEEIVILVCLFVLRFYGPVNPVGSCQARSVDLTTRLLGRLSPLRG